MAHFAKINDKNVVEQVIVIDDEHQENGAQFINEILKLDGLWIQTSYNNKIRGKFAGVGMNYDSDADIFYASQPDKKWVLDKITWSWNPPTPQPSENHYWDYEISDWVEDASTL